MNTPLPITMDDASPDWTPFLSNEVLEAEWSKKLPKVKPTDEQLTAFALGTEVGVARERCFQNQNWSRFHHVMHRHGLHPGRTDDDLIETLDRHLTATLATPAASKDEPVAGEPVMWQYRWFDDHAGWWDVWKPVEARSRISTVEDALAEFRSYIASGYKYELRALCVASPAPLVADASMQAEPIESYPAADQAFFKFWYSHMRDDTMQPPLHFVSHSDARYIWDAAIRTKSPQPEPLTDAEIGGIACDSDAGDLGAMTQLVEDIAQAKTNGLALFKLAKFRKATRVQAIRAALSRVAK